MLERQNFFDGIQDIIETVGGERGDAPVARDRQAWCHPVTDARGAQPVCMRSGRRSARRWPRVRRFGRSSLKEFADKIGEGNNIFLRAAFGSGSTVMSMHDPIIQDVFAYSTAAFLMTRFSSAPVGDALELVHDLNSARLSRLTGRRERGPDR